MKILHFLSEPSQKCGGFISQNISLLLTFFLPRVKRKEIINTQKPIVTLQKMLAPQAKSRNE